MRSNSNSNSNSNITNEYLELNLLVVYLYCAGAKPVAEKLWEQT